MPHTRTPAGYVVEIAMPGPEPQLISSTVRGVIPNNPPLAKHYFNAAFSSADSALEAVRKIARAPADATMRIVRQLSPAEVAATHLHDGDVKPA